MKKYYATAVDSEFVDCDVYSDELLMKEQGIAICGNSDYYGMNKDLIEEVKHALNDCEYDINVNRDNLAEESITLAKLEEYETEIIKLVDYYFNAKLSTEDKFKLVELCDKYYSCSSREAADILIQALSLTSGKKYKVKEIHGYCQGEWNNLYYPEDTSDEYLNLLEALYFGTGTEFEITCDAVEPEELDDADTYFDYTYLSGTKEIKTWLAKNIGCNEDEIVVRTIKKRHTTYFYDYEEN